MTCRAAVFAQSLHALNRPWINPEAVLDVSTTPMTEAPTVKQLGALWRERYIIPRYKHPEVVERVSRLHIDPVMGR